MWKELLRLISRGGLFFIEFCQVIFVSLFSSVAGECCNEECTFIPESQAHVCQAETECSLESTCKYPLIR